MEDLIFRVINDMPIDKYGTYIKCGSFVSINDDFVHGEWKRNRFIRVNYVDEHGKVAGNPFVMEMSKSFFDKHLLEDLQPKSYKNLLLQKLAHFGELKLGVNDTSIETESNRNKVMYSRRIRHYYKKGIRITLRPDGTEYISKTDMPA